MDHRLPTDMPLSWSFPPVLQVVSKLLFLQNLHSYPLLCDCKSCKNAFGHTLGAFAGSIRSHVAMIKTINKLWFNDKNFTMRNSCPALLAMTGFVNINPVTTFRTSSSRHVRAPSLVPVFLKRGQLNPGYALPKKRGQQLFQTDFCHILLIYLKLSNSFFENLHAPCW